MTYLIKKMFKPDPTPVVFPDNPELEDRINESVSKPSFKMMVGRLVLHDRASWALAHSPKRLSGPRGR